MYVCALHINEVRLFVPFCPWRRYCPAWNKCIPPKNSDVETVYDCIWRWGPVGDNQGVRADP